MLHELATVRLMCSMARLSSIHDRCSNDKERLTWILMAKLTMVIGKACYQVQLPPHLLSATCSEHSLAHDPCWIRGDVYQCCKSLQHRKVFCYQRRHHPADSRPSSSPIFTGKGNNPILMTGTNQPEHEMLTLFHPVGMCMKHVFSTTLLWPKLED